MDDARGPAPVPDLPLISLARTLRRRAVPALVRAAVAREPGTVYPGRDLRSPHGSGGWRSDRRGVTAGPVVHQNGRCPRRAPCLSGDARAGLGQATRAARRRAGAVAPLPLVVTACIALLLAAPDARLRAAVAPTSGAAVRVLSFNVHNYLTAGTEPAKSPASIQAVIEIIAAVHPDVAVLIEVGGAAALADIVQRLVASGEQFPFSTVVTAEDQTRNLAVIARQAPVRVRHEVDATYNLGEQQVRIQRGFAYCMFQWPNGYVLHLLGAHLKSKMFDPLGQTDMRRYEARQLRYLVDDILEAEPQANILAVGDLNDSPDSSPLTTLYGRRYKPERQLYDLRPVDEAGMAWTHYYEPADAYTRIDYALASLGLLPEVDLDACVIPTLPQWRLASDHRPVVAVLRPADAPMSEAVGARFERNTRLAPAAATPTDPDRVVGSRKVRR